jgi:hypothetical protein
VEPTQRELKQSIQEVEGRPRLTVDTAGAATGINADAPPEDSDDADRPFDPAAAYFPTSFQVLAPEGTVFRAPPLSTKNFQCWVRHRNLHANQNVLYPVACQVCGGEDTGDRFTCGWCFLRICQGCRVALARCRGDLGKLVEKIEGAGDPTATTTSRESAMEVAPLAVPLR